MSLLLLMLGLFLFIKIKMFLNRYSEAKEFYKCESPIEEQLFNELRKRKGKDGEQLKVFTQVPCGNYRIDLSVFYKGKKIAIECDGKAYHTGRDQMKHDKKKDHYLKKHGWSVIRFTGSEIFRNSKGCADKVEALQHEKRFSFL